MYLIHEGEILLKETYGTSSKEIFYVKPPDQSNVVILEEGKLVNAYSWFTRIFLPHGYPHTVSKDYAAYQIWDTAQAFCSTITGILSTQEVLRGVGVGDNNATPLAATVTWVIKDGCGHLGRILFACTHGTHLDAYSKKWRLYADVLNDAAMCIELSLPLFKNYTTIALCVSTTMKAIVGVAGGATRVALTQHHALCGNMADVSAKDSAQETAVNLIASFAALFLISVFGNSIILFLFTMVLHVTFNYLAVRAVCLKTLNEPRYLQVISSYIRREIIASPCDVNRHEPVVLYKVGNNNIDVRLCGFRIKLGYSLKNLTLKNPKYTYLSNIKNTYLSRRYLLYPNIGDREMYVLLREGATSEDTLCAYFHAVLLSIVVCAINSEPLIIYKDHDDLRPFGQICHTLQAADWSREPADNIGFSGFIYEPSHELIMFLDDIVNKEWIRFKTGLIQIGWDISKHLLLSDEWRISCHSINDQQLSRDEKAESELKLPMSSNMNIPEILEYSAANRPSTAPFIIEPEVSLSKPPSPSSLRSSSDRHSKSSLRDGSSKKTHLHFPHEGKGHYDKNTDSPTKVSSKELNVTPEDKPAKDKEKV